MKRYTHFRGQRRERRVNPDAVDPSKIITPESLAASGTEHGNQAAVFQWIATTGQYTYPDLNLAFAIPSGGLRHPATAAKLKAEGVKPGVSDVFLPVPRLGFHGMWAELKLPEYRNRKNGGRSDDQIKFQEAMRRNGYHVVTCYGWFELASALCSYLGWQQRGSLEVTNK